LGLSEPATKGGRAGSNRAGSGQHLSAWKKGKCCPAKDGVRGTWSFWGSSRVTSRGVVVLWSRGVARQTVINQRVVEKKGKPQNRKVLGCVRRQAPHPRGGPKIGDGEMWRTLQACVTGVEANAKKKAAAEPYKWGEKAVWSKTVGNSLSK